MKSIAHHPNSLASPHPNLASHLATLQFDTWLRPNLQLIYNIPNLLNDILLGKEVWVGWPHLIEAKVRSVSTVRSLYREPARAADPPHDWNIQVQHYYPEL